jgi:transcriptional regulator with XRE-family HTH domain
MTPARQPAPGDDLRKVRFSRFMERVLGAAKERGMTIKGIEAATKVSKSTFYRWRDGEFIPKVDELRRFCAGLGVDISEAYAALGWSEAEAGRPSVPEPIITDPDLRVVMKTLNDPNVSPADKLRIRRMLRALAAESETPTEQ